MYYLTNLAENLLIVTLGLGLACFVQTGSLNDVILTPFWDVTVVEGESVYIDCGAYNSGNPASVVDVSWLKNGTSINSSDSRVSEERLDDTHHVYTVCALSVRTALLSDAGSYDCEVKWDANAVVTRNIDLHVLPAGKGCTFESSGTAGQCQWTGDDASSWILRTSTTYDATNPGPSMDHTYLLSKYLGAYLLLNKAAMTPKSKAARLVSPMFQKTSSASCFQLSYFFAGCLQGQITISIQTTANSTDLISVTLTPQSANTWHTTTVTIPPQAASYQVAIATAVSDQSCGVAPMLALDDILLVDNAPCQQNDTLTETQKTKNLVRLTNGKSADGSDGQVQLLHDGQWSSVCLADFGATAAQVICNMLGFGDRIGSTLKPNSFQSSADIYTSWDKPITCLGTESHLALCRQEPLSGDPWDERNACNHTTNDVGVQCLLPAASSSTSSSSTSSATAAATSTTASTTAATATTTTVVAVSTTKPTASSTVTTKATSTTAAVSSTTAARVPNVNTTFNADDALKELDSSDNVGVAVGILVSVLIAALVILGLVYRQRTMARKNAYITFGNPVYSREHLPSNDYSMESPLTLASSGYTVLA